MFETMLPIAYSSRSPRSPRSSGGSSYSGGSEIDGGAPDVVNGVHGGVHGGVPGGVPGGAGGVQGVEREKKANCCTFAQRSTLNLSPLQICTFTQAFETTTAAGFLLIVFDAGLLATTVHFFSFSVQRPRTRNVPLDFSSSVAMLAKLFRICLATHFLIWQLAAMASHRVFLVMAAFSCKIKRLEPRLQRLDLCLCLLVVQWVSGLAGSSTTVSMHPHISVHLFTSQSLSHSLSVYVLSPDLCLYVFLSQPCRLLPLRTSSLCLCFYLRLCPTVSRLLCPSDMMPLCLSAPLCPCQTVLLSLCLSVSPSLSRSLCMCVCPCSLARDEKGDLDDDGEGRWQYDGINVGG